MVENSRRQWIKRLGIAIAGVSLAKSNILAMRTGTNALLEIAPNERTIRLSSNENPYGPSPMARTAMADAVSVSNRYQWQMIKELKEAIGSRHNVQEAQVHLGAGSTQIIDNVIQMGARHKGNFVVSEPTFSRWAGSAEKNGLKKISVPLTRSKRNDLRAMLNAIDTDTRFVYLCNPNNPTGTICGYENIVSFIKEATKHTMVVVDEAYLDYTTQSSLCGLTVRNKNLVVVKTFSKIFGLAGARIGYAIAHANTVKELTEMRSGADIDISAVSLAGAIASLKDKRFIEQSYLKNEQARAYTITKLEGLGIKCIVSHTNFIYFSLANYEKDYFALLKDNNIEGTMIFEGDGKWTRITVGTMQEMERFIEAIA